MSTVCGVALHKKICRACLSYDEKTKYVKMKKRKRYFTRLANIPIDTTGKNWLCVECAHKITSMLHFYDKVVQVNSELNKALNQMESGAKINIHHVERARKSVYFHKLSSSRTVQIDTVNCIRPILYNRWANCNVLIEHIFAESDISDNIQNILTDAYVKTEMETLDVDYLDDTLEGDHVTNFDDGIGLMEEGSELDRRIMELNIASIKIEDDFDPIGSPTPAKRLKLGHKTGKKQFKHVSGNGVEEGAISTVTNNKKVLVIPLSLEQQIEEHKQLALDKNYMNAIYKCTVCYKGFSYEETYKSHMETHNKDYGNYKCSICQKYIKSRNSFQSHMLNHSKKYKCTECDFTRAWRTLVVEHYAVEHDPHTIMLTCDLCGKDFLKKTQLRHHLRYTHREGSLLDCDHCDKKFKTIESHRRHIVTQHLGDRPEGEKRFICLICGDRFHNSTFLKRHQVKHSTSRDFYCVDCDTYFKSEMILKAHLRTSSKHFDPGKLVQCSQCNFKTVGARELTRHVEARHLGITNFQCAKCPRAFYAGNALRRHCREAHEGYQRPKMHVCDVCGKTFAVKKTLICHRNTHTGEKPYECKECDSKFAGSGALYTHVKLVHRKLKRDIKGRFKPPHQTVETNYNVKIL